MMSDEHNNILRLVMGDKSKDEMGKYLLILKYYFPATPVCAVKVEIAAQVPNFKTLDAAITAGNTWVEQSSKIVEVSRFFEIVEIP